MLVTVVRTELKLNSYKEASHCVTVIVMYYLCNETAVLLFVLFVKHFYPPSRSAFRNFKL